jgi:superfamily II DNA/RNA helicase
VLRTVWYELLQNNKKKQAQQGGEGAPAATAAAARVLVFVNTAARAVALHQQLCNNFSPEALPLPRQHILQFHKRVRRDEAQSNLDEFMGLLPAAAAAGGAGEAAAEATQQQQQANEDDDQTNGIDMKVLIATNVAARGIDFVNCTHIVQYDFASNMMDYLHRVGRTGRTVPASGERFAAGKVINFYSRAVDADLVARVRAADGAPLTRSFSRKRSFRKKIKKAANADEKQKREALAAAAAKKKKSKKKADDSTAATTTAQEEQ